jgi:pyruvate kinase
LYVITADKSGHQYKINLGRKCFKDVREIGSEYNITLDYDDVHPVLQPGRRVLVDLTGPLK